MTREQLKEMPKGEFHLHLEGSLPYSLLRNIDTERFAELPPFWNRDYRFSTFADFDRELLSLAGVWFTSVERYHTAAKAIFDDAREQGIRYLETSIASGCLEFGNLDLFEVCAAIKSTVPPDMTVRLFLGIHHSGYDSFASSIEEGLNCPNLDGFDIHGDETEPLEAWTADLYRRAAEAGKFTKCHAGEFMGPEFIKTAVNILKVNRIEHGVRAVEDEETLRLLAERNVTLDVCPVSNVKLQVVPSIEEHPLKKLMQSGVRCTVNRDDPLIFGSTLEEEYFLIQENMGLKDRDIVSLVKNGFDAALVSDGERLKLHATLDRFLKENNITAQ